MQALGSLSPLELVEGKIQKEVGEFLQLKSSLNWLRGSQKLEIAGEAEALTVKQRQLEADLAIVLDNLEQFKSGAWDMGSLASTANFAYELVKQIDDVKDLEKKAYASGESPDSGIDIPTALIGLTLVGGFFIWWANR